MALNSHEGKAHPAVCWKHLYEKVWQRTSKVEAIMRENVSSSFSTLPASKANTWSSQTFHSQRLSFLPKSMEFHFMPSYSYCTVMTPYSYNWGGAFTCDDRSLSEYRKIVDRCTDFALSFCQMLPAMTSLLFQTHCGWMDDGEWCNGSNLHRWLAIAYTYIGQIDLDSVFCSSPSRVLLPACHNEKKCSIAANWAHSVHSPVANHRGPHFVMRRPDWIKENLFSSTYSLYTQPS